jgi:Bacterial Ig domain
MNFDYRRVERALLVILAITCATLFSLRYFPSQASNQIAAYQIQQAYYKLCLTDRAALTNVFEIAELIPLLTQYTGFEAPKRLPPIVVAPGTSIRDGTAFFLPLPKGNKYAMAIPPTIQMLSPTNAQDYAFGEEIKITAKVADLQCNVILVDVKVNDDVVGHLPCIAGMVTGVWTPVEEGTYTLALVVYNEFGLTATATASNVTAVVNQPSTIQLVDITDGITLQAGATHQILVSATDPNRTDRVTDVSLFLNGESIGVKKQPPYAFNLGPLKPGIYALSANGHDHHGALGQSPDYKIYIK